MAEEASSGGERTEAPSAKRREDFRKKGQVAQSKEVQTAALFTILLLFWIFYMPAFWQGLTELLAALWQSIGDIEITPRSTMNLAFFLVQKSAILLAPLFLLVLIIGFFSSFLQFGWLLTGTPLIPDFSKLDPIKGFGRLFSQRSIIEVIKSLLKVALISWVATSTVMNHFHEALVLVDTSASITLSYLAQVSTLILAKVCAVLILLAILDFSFTNGRWRKK